MIPVYLGHTPKDRYPTTETLSHPGSLILYSQYPGNGNSLDFHQEMNG